jgi:hypothetical protein
MNIPSDLIRAVVCSVLLCVLVLCTGCRSGCDALPAPDFARSLSSVMTAGALPGTRTTLGDTKDQLGDYQVVVSHVWICDDCFWVVFATNVDPAIAADLSRGMLLIVVEYRFAESSPWSRLQRATEERLRPVFGLMPSIPGPQLRAGPNGLTEVLYDGVRPRGVENADRVYLRFPNPIYIGEHSFTLIVPESVAVVHGPCGPTPNDGE